MSGKKRNHLFNAAFRELQIKPRLLFFVTGSLVVKRRQHDRHVAAVICQHAQRMFPLLAPNGTEQFGISQRVLRIAVDSRTRLRQLYTVRPAQKQARSQFLFQFANDHADMGLCRIKFLCRRCQRPATRAGNKI